MKEVFKIKFDPVKDPVVKRFINLYIQRLDMNDARQIIQRVKELKILANEDRENLTTAQYLFSAFVVTYYRCFSGQNQRGSIDKNEFFKLLNEDQKLAHEELHHLRNKYMAHQDETPHISLDVYGTIYQDEMDQNSFKYQFDYDGKRTTLWNDNMLGLFGQLAEIAYEFINSKTIKAGDKLMQSKLNELINIGEATGTKIKWILNY